MTKLNDATVWSTPPQAPRRSTTAPNPNPSLGVVGTADRKRKRGDTVVDDEGNVCDPLDVDLDGYCEEDQ